MVPGTVNHFLIHKAHYAALPFRLIEEIADRNRYFHLLYTVTCPRFSLAYHTILSLAMLPIRLLCLLLILQPAVAFVSSLKRPFGLRPSAVASTEVAEPSIDYDAPEDAVIHIKPAAMQRLRELREKDPNQSLILRMGVRNGGCSGLSYIMDFSTEDAIQDDDAIDEYTSENIKCVVDAKSMLYLYGLELDYSDQLIGGGFKFFNPNAEDSCGCGSSFGV